MENTVYRIIDANFNRTREAFRMMEEYVRFWLNRPAFNARIKQMRHRLCGAISQIDAQKLICSRDVDGDAGRHIKVDDQLYRQSLSDCFTAAVKRAGEALRVLAECTQSVIPAMAAEMEQLRFDVYTLERDVLLASEAKRKFEPVRLYVLINATPDISDMDVLELTRHCAAGGADCLQLRAKNISDKRFYRLAAEFSQLCRDHNALSMINDRVDIALLSGADGVHLGQEDISVSSARKIATRPLIIGASTHTPHELQQAVDEDYDYIAIGPAFASPTKPDLKVAGIPYLQASLSLLCGAEIPHVAIGGINAETLPLLIQIGIRAVAVSGAVHTSDAEQSCKRLKSILLQSHP